MRTFAFALLMTLPLQALAQEAPTFPECLVMPPNAEIVTAEAGNDSTAYRLRFVLKVADRVAAFEAVRATLEAREETAPQNMSFTEGQIIHSCDAETVGIFQSDMKPGPGEVEYLVGLAGG